MPRLPEPPWIYALHEPGGEYLFADKKGWIVFTEEIGHDVDNHAGKDFSGYAGQGYGVVARVNHGYGETGTIPEPSLYGVFARRFANYVAASKGCSRWIVGNEWNHAQELPKWQDGSRPKITAQQYADCFNQVEAVVHAIPGHEEDEVIPAAIAPWNDQAGDWIKNHQDVLNLVRRPGAVNIHTYTHGDNPALITAETMAGGQYANYHWDFRTYRDFLLATPDKWKHLPAYITETDQNDPWTDANNGWVQAAYKEIDEWNRKTGTQKIKCLALYRWPKNDKWSIVDKDNVHVMIRDAVAQGYRVPATLIPVPDETVFIPNVGTGGTPVAAQPQSKIVWDERLTRRGIELTKYIPQPGDTGYWELIEGQYWEEKEHTFAVTLDENGNRKPGVAMRFWDGGNLDKRTELKPNDRWMVDFPMFAHSRSYGLKVLDGPSDSVFGMGLGSVEQPDWNIHVSYHFAWRWRKLSGAVVTLPPVPAQPVSTPRFKLNDTLYAGGHVNLRRTPGYVSKTPADIIDTLDPGEKLFIQSGPRFVDGLVWWQVMTSAPGWVAESDPAGSVLLTVKPPTVPLAEIPLLVHPVKNADHRGVTQPFGVNEANYKQFVYDGVPLLGHNGVDFATPTSSQIVAVDEGTVIEVGDEGSKGFGKYIKLKHTWGESLYAHLNSASASLESVVSRGQVIAASGNTGNSSGPHLHFGLRKNGYRRNDGWGGYIDPLPYLEPAYTDIKYITHAAADEFGIDRDVMLNLVFAENRFKTDSTPSSAGAIGPAQIMPATWAEWAPRVGAKNIHNPVDNVRVGAAYLGWLLGQFKDKGDLQLHNALTAYNWGIGNTRAQGASNSPLKTTIYVNNILYGAQLLKAVRKL